MTVREPKPFRWAYSGYSGVGTVEKAIAVVKAKVITQKPAPGGALPRPGVRGRRGPGAGRRVGAAAEGRPAPPRAGAVQRAMLPSLGDTGHRVQRRELIASIASCDG
ncbi:hypothetical protein GCM10027168_57780 [Streptomyces capparidis]